MSVIISTAGTPAGTFTVDGILYNKIYQPLTGGGDYISLINSYDTRQVLVPNTIYSGYTINGVGYGTAALTIAALVPIVYESYQGGTITSVFGRTGVVVADTADYSSFYISKTGGTMTGALTVPADPYAIGWNGNNTVPTKNDVYDKIEALVLGGAITSVFGRTGVVTALSTDYSAFYLGISATAANSTLFNGLATTAFLSATANDSTSGSLTAASFITGAWTIDSSGTDLVFKYSGITKFTITSAGAVTIAGNLTAG